MSTKTRKLSAGQCRPEVPQPVPPAAARAADMQAELIRAQEMARAREQWLRAIRSGQRPN